MKNLGQPKVCEVRTKMSNNLGTLHGTGPWALTPGLVAYTGIE